MHSRLLTGFVRWFNTSSPLFGARIGLLACFGLAVGGISLGLLEDSLAVQTDGSISGIDILNSLLFIAALNQGIRSADGAHNYGYGKYESMGILASALLLFVVLLYTIFHAALGFGAGTVVGNYPLLIGFSLLSLLVTYNMARLQRSYAERFDMPLLRYDSDVWRVDTILEVGVLANLIAGAVLHAFDLVGIARVIDSITAICMLLYAIKIPLTHAREALNHLLDKTLPEEIQLDIITVIGENISSICEFRSIHTRQSGKDLFMELDVVLPFDHNLEQAYEIERHIQDSLTGRYPNAIVRMYVEPCKRDCIHAGQRNCPILVMNKPNE